MQYIAAVFLLLSLYIACSSAILSSYFRICHLSNKDFEGCLNQSINDAAKTHKNGVPELGLPKIDPLHIRTTELKDRMGGVNFYQKLTNLTIYGISNFMIKDIQADKINYALKMNITLPYLECRTKYNMNVKLFGMTLEGSGEAKITFTNVNSTINIAVEKYTSEGDEYFRVSTFSWDIEPELATFEFSSLSSIVTKFINKFWKIAFDLYKYIPREEFGKLFKDRANQFLAKFPASEILPA